jgi:hypothetical protein
MMVTSYLYVLPVCEQRADGGVPLCAGTDQLYGVVDMSRTAKSLRKLVPVSPPKIMTLLSFAYFHNMSISNETNRL